METYKNTRLLLRLLLLLQAYTIRGDNCPSVRDKNLTCYSDYNRTITCLLNSTYERDHRNATCTLHTKRVNTKYAENYITSCKLEPVDVSRPALKSCTLKFKFNEIFLSYFEFSITLKCGTVEKILANSYKPACHIKLNRPGKPDINFTTVSWFPQLEKHSRISLYTSQLQWKREDQSWSDAHEEPIQKSGWEFEAELDEDLLIQGERYEARIRVQASDYLSTWSDWSPVASWVSTVGKVKPTPSPLPDFAGIELGMIVAGAVVALFLALILFRRDKANWVYKKIRGPPLLDPGKSFLRDVNFQNWLSPHLTSQSFLSPLKPEEIINVEVTSTVDAVTPCKSEAALLEKMRSESSYESTSSSFTNPSYSQLCPPPPPPLSLPFARNLEPCATDAPNGSVGRQGEGKTAEQDREEERRKEVEIQQLFSKGNSNNESVQVISDYEKVEKPQVERFRLQSLDSGMCSGEEVSQESLEADSIHVTDGHDEGPEGKEQEREGGNGKVDFHKLFGGSGSVFGKGSIQVCSDYERVQKLQPHTSELPSLDSGVSSGGEEQVSHEESLEDIDKFTDSTNFPFSPLPSCALPCSLTSFPQLPPMFSETGLQPPSPNHILGGIALMSVSRSMEASGDGYMPVKQEQSV
ncbi:uncharacterized protein LOC108889056 isoform X2 [Lates calcarifer]|uniref:Uncharacterized protein LOC108889056 isoform X2 n=1 Tax=Lates calcarifer TaxID=8187 RepID=A0AAJ8B602_LATCA|nr:uncharacterized protein LOC108889056 isoform X2 [Lates calcarifer]